VLRHTGAGTADESAKSNAAALQLILAWRIGTRPRLVMRRKNALLHTCVLARGGISSAEGFCKRTEARMHMHMHMSAY
jgi:hypothetical protein